MSSNAEHSEDLDFKSVSEASFRKLHEKATKEGYVDGVEAGRESVFQVSFDAGWKDGFRTGFELEKYKSFCEAVQSQKENDNVELSNEAKVYSEKFNSEIATKDHCQADNDQDESLDVISEKQSKYVDDKLAQLSAALPVTSKLFQS